MECKGIMQTEIIMKINLVDVDDEKHEFRLRLKDEDQWKAYRSLLESGATITFKMQKVFEKEPSISNDISRKGE